MELPDTKELITRLGGPAAVGRVIDRTHSAVCQWDRIPADYVVALEKWSLDRGSPVMREEMRPDLFIRTSQ